MDQRLICLCVSGLLLGGSMAFAEPTNIAEDAASQSGYGGSWGNDKNGGSGFAAWVTTSEGTGADQHAGFFIADSNNGDLNGIAKEGKAFGIFANGAGFEQAVAYRGFNKPLESGDSFSFMMETGGFEKKSDKESAGGGAIGLVLRSGNANSAPTDYNSGAMFEIGHYQGVSNYQIYDGTSNSDSGVAFTDGGIIVTVTVTGSDSYDLENQTAKDKNLTKLPGRKFGSAGTPKSGSIESMAVFNRNGEKNDAYFNGFQISRDSQ